MAGTVTNLIQGTGTLYIATFGATEPAVSGVATAPVSGTWTDLGFTKEGLNLSIAQEYAELEVDQLVDTPGRRLTKREYTLSTSLAEGTLTNLSRALNSTAPTTAVGYEHWSPDAYLPGVEPTYKALIFDGFAPNGKIRRVVIRKALQVGDVEANYSKDGQLVYAVEFKAHYVTSAILPIQIIDATA